MVSQIEIKFHMGNVVKYISQIYSKPTATPRECVQNALDKFAQKIIIIIDHVKKRLTIYDDGNGASEVEMRRKFENIGLSLKIDDDDLAGKKGIGNLAAISIAKRWVLISRDHTNKNDPFKKYVLDRKELEKSSNIEINASLLEEKYITRDLDFKPTSMVMADGVDENVLKNLTIEAIEEEILDSFHQQLKSRKVEVKIVSIKQIKNGKNKVDEKILLPAKFRGSRMDPVTIQTKYGEIKFGFYFSSEPLKKPLILIEHKKNYSLPFRKLFDNKQLDEKIYDIFKQGLFEGTIALPFCALNADRDGFEWNDELGAFIDSVRIVFEQALKPLVDQFEEEKREEKYKQITKSIHKKMSDLFKSNPNLIPDNLRALVKRMNGITAQQAAKTKTIPKTLLNDQLKKSRQKSSETKSREKRTGNIGIDYVMPNAEEGLKWHSKFEEGCIKVNCFNDSFIQAERMGMTQLTNYVFLLVQKEFTCAVVRNDPNRSFSEIFEKVFMSYWGANLVRPNKA
ncbi:MAG: ATP-binding protein [bacterium]|nr:ATP-binding protein [bacterium]